MKRTSMLLLSVLASCGTDEPSTLPEDMMSAMQRDLGQTEDEIARRLVAEASAAQLEPQLPSLLGDAYGGAWMSADGSALRVGITDPALADAVRATGAEPVVVSRAL